MGGLRPGPPNVVLLLPKLDTTLFNCDIVRFPFRICMSKQQVKKRIATISTVRRVYFYSTVLPVGHCFWATLKCQHSAGFV